MIHFKKIILFGKGGVATVAALLLTLSLLSCDSVIYDDDLEACREGLTLRFIYDYNMEYANAFPSHVDCLTLYIYDKDGNYIKSRKETSSVLQDENYLMDIELSKGEYKIVALGGIACEKASFYEVAKPTLGSSLYSLETQMYNDNYTSKENLHGFYFGSLDITVTEGTRSYDTGTVYMMKNTNNVRIILSGVDSDATADDYEYLITADNSLFDCENNIIPNGIITYSPWDKGEYTINDTTTESEEYFLYAEISLSRLIASDDVRLKVIDKSTSTEIINIPLVQYLLLVRSNHYSYMEPQEYLDREDEWTIMFQMVKQEESNPQVWPKTSVTTNDWVVRLNDISSLF